MQTFEREVQARGRQRRRARAAAGGSRPGEPSRSSCTNGNSKLGPRRSQLLVPVPLHADRHELQVEMSLELGIGPGQAGMATRAYRALGQSATGRHDIELVLCHAVLAQT